jgi:hypothetical protein
MNHKSGTIQTDITGTNKPISLAQFDPIYPVMKLDGKRVLVTGKEFDLGKELRNTEPEIISHHVQAVVYYENGLPEFDKIFAPQGYIKSGYVCDLFALENGIAVVFAKYSDAEVIDIGIAHIERSKILNFEEFNESSLEVVKKEAGKHQAKTFLRKATGVGLMASAFTDNIVSVNTCRTSGSKFKLYYVDETDNVKYINLYSPDEHKHKIVLFLNTYYKSNLPKEALNENTEGEGSNCFIATACYRDVFSKEVVFFRWYRDNKLYKNHIGKALVKFYYIITPHIYRYLFNRPNLSNKIKYFLNKLYLYLLRNSVYSRVHRK